MWIGTSGYNYPEWRGSFYREKFPTAKMLPYYAERFSTVEINYTFYRMPNAKTIAGWNAETPAGFAFALKASRRITHAPADPIPHFNLAVLLDELGRADEAIQSYRQAIDRDPDFADAHYNTSASSVRRSGSDPRRSDTSARPGRSTAGPAPVGNVYLFRAPRHCHRARQSAQRRTAEVSWPR